MSDDTPSSPLTLDELRETLERLGDLSLDLNDRIEEQTKAVKHATTMTNEARRAAEATKQQTDPEHYADFAVTLMEDRTGKIIERMNDVASGLIRASNHTATVLKEAEQDRSAAQRQLWEREQKLDQLKRRLPWLGVGALVLALAMTVMLPRFMASYGPTCAILGGVWTTTSTNTDVCAFYRE